MFRRLLLRVFFTFARDGAGPVGMRSPYDVDALRCLYIPPLSTLQARFAQMPNNTLLLPTTRSISIRCFWGAMSADVLIASGLCLGWWLMYYYLHLCFSATLSRRARRCGMMTFGTGVVRISWWVSALEQHVEWWPDLLLDD